MTAVQTRIFYGFDDVGCGPTIWNGLLSAGDTDSGDLTWEWQSNWWDSLGHGRLLLIGAELDKQLVAIAPLFTNEGMIFNLCPENHLDFVGDIGSPGVLSALLTTAMQEVPDFTGFRFYFIPDFSRTGERLRRAASCLGLSCLQEESIVSPILDLASSPAEASAAVRKKSLVRHENYFRREGQLEVDHMRDPDEITPHLDEFFAQHIKRRAVTPYPSLFEDIRQQEYYKNITTEFGPTGYLRFTRMLFDGRPIAYHMGYSYRKRYIYGIPSFAIELAEHSPGEVLLRQLILAAKEEQVDCFDFGIGGEAYKYRFATQVPVLHTWGLYIPDV